VPHVRASFLVVRLFGSVSIVREKPRGGAPMKDSAMGMRLAVSSNLPRGVANNDEQQHAVAAATW
jgi:hypothetical protein